jgi:hypothetical protein
MKPVQPGLFDHLIQPVKPKAVEPPKKLPMPRAKPKRPENLDRPLTAFEKIMWARKTGGIKPASTATLRHFRRGMGGGGWRSTD